MSSLLPAGVRTVAVWGAADRVIPAANAASLEGGPAGRVIEGVVGHTAQLEAPGEVVSAVEATMAG